MADKKLNKSIGRIDFRSIPKHKGVRDDQDLKEIKTNRDAAIFGGSLGSVTPDSPSRKDIRKIGAQNAAPSEIGPAEIGDYARQGKVWATTSTPDEINSRAGVLSISGHGQKGFVIDKVSNSPPHLKEHEAIHAALSRVAGLSRQGKIEIVDKHLSPLVHPEDHKRISALITHYGYDPKSPHFNEEVVAHLPQILQNNAYRQSLKKINGLSDKELNTTVQRARKTWNAIRQWSHKIKEEEL